MRVRLARIKAALKGGFLKSERLPLLVGIFYFMGLIAFAQVGINTTDPRALLDIPASNSAAPSSTDGVLIPRVSSFPSLGSLEAEQDGMLIFYLGDASRTKGFYYYNHAIPNWLPLSSDRQQIDFFQFIGNALRLSLQNDNEPIQAVDLSSLNQTEITALPFSKVRLPGSVTYSPGYRRIEFLSSEVDLTNNVNLSLDRFTSFQSGYYRINVTLTFQLNNSNSSSTYGIAILKNGALVSTRFVQGDGTTGNDFSVTLTTTSFLNSGQYIEIHGYKSGGVFSSDFTVLGGSTSWIEIERIR